MIIWHKVYSMRIIFNLSIPFRFFWGRFLLPKCSETDNK